MKRYFFIFILAVFIMSGLLNVSAFGEGPVQQNEEVAESAEQVEMTAEEITTRLKEIFQYHPDICASVQGIEQQENEEGAAYTYKGTPLENLDKDTLMGILRICNQQLSWKNYQRLQKQLKQLKQIEQTERTQKMLRQQQQQKTPRIPKTNK